MHILKITSDEAVRLFIILIISKIFFWDITKLVVLSSTAAWIHILLSTLIALVLFYIIKKSSGKTEVYDIFDTTEYAFSKVGLILFGIFLSVIQIMNFVIVLKAYCTTITTVTLTNSSNFFVLVFILSTLVASGYLGIKSVTKLSSVSFFVIILFLALLIVFDIPNFEYDNIFPIFGSGIDGFLQSYKNVGFFNELIFLFFLIPVLKNKNDVWKIGTKSIIISSVIITSLTLVFTLIIPYPVNTRYYLPVFEITSSVNFFVIFQRAEAIYLLLWIFTCFLYTGATFCFLLYTIKRTFSLSDSKALIPALLMIVVTLLALFENINAMDKVHDILNYIFSIVLFGVITLIYGAGAFKRRKKE